MAFTDPDDRRSPEPNLHARDSREIVEADSRDRGPPLRSYRTILKQQIVTGLVEYRRPTLGLALSSFSAGLDLGFSVLLMAAVMTAFRGAVSDALEHVIVSNMYAVGFLLVILGRSELFTEHTALAVLPVLDGRSTLGELMRVWTVVYLGNVVGAALCALAIVWIGHSLDVAAAWAFTSIAESLVDHPWWVILISAIAAGWLMGEVAWLIGAARDTVSQILFVWLITTAIGFLGLHHVIAGTAEVVAGMLTSPRVGWQQLSVFLIASTLGNAIGGVFFVAVIKYGHAVHAGVQTEEEIESEAEKELDNS